MLPPTSLAHCSHSRRSRGRPAMMPIRRSLDRLSGAGHSSDVVRRVSAPLSRARWHDAGRACGTGGRHSKGYQRARARPAPLTIPPDGAGARRCARPEPGGARRAAAGSPRSKAGGCGSRASARPTFQRPRRSAACAEAASLPHAVHRARAGASKARAPDRGARLPADHAARDWRDRQDSPGGRGCQHCHQFVDGVTFVPLGPTSEPQAVVPAILGA